MISREIIHNIHSKLDDNKAIILMGPRQVGKTTLLKYLQREIVEAVEKEAEHRREIAEAERLKKELAEKEIFDHQWLKFGLKIQLPSEN